MADASPVQPDRVEFFAEERYIPQLYDAILPSRSENLAIGVKRKCRGSRPVAVVFSREVTPEVTKLIKKLDQCTAKNGECKMGSYVVFLCDKEGLDKELKDLAEKEKLKHIVLSIDNPAGPQEYKISKDAEVTVLLFNKHIVKSNHAFKKGEAKDQDIEAIVKEVPKILPEKK